ncbi:uncharacterized protein PAC_13349 [Phialocephala subalpina]|uniref:Uncharacterized protein n=1 Tax=Phialocephala subalpina TaxID=576137 RepID=A0A1L7XEJ3_9HELO|nr:uncharacterized protein PAC_13349 [Phialocephala subalpina]
MELRSRRNSMITDAPRIEEPEEEDPQEDVSSISTTRGQLGSPISSRTRSYSGSDSQQATLTPILEDLPAPEPGQHARYYRLDLHEDFILYSHSDTDDGTEEQGSNAYLSPQRQRRPRTYRPIAPRSETTQAQSTQAASSSSSIQAVGGTQQDMTPHRQQSSMHMQLPTPSQTNPTMMPYFEQDSGPWSPAASPTAPESRKRALSSDIPDINQYPRDRPFDDKMQDHFKKIEQGHGGQESSDEEKKRLRKKRRMGGKRRVSTRSMVGKKTTNPGKTMIKVVARVANRRSWLHDAQIAFDEPRRRGGRVI